MNQEQLFKNHLRASGERVTTTRLGVFRVLLRHAPLSMARLIDKAQADGIDPVTTYRTVDLFRKLALVQELGMGRNRLLELSDSYHAHHHHFTCVRCGKILDFDSEPIESELHKVSRVSGFEIHSHQLEITGVCAECRRK
jgi:Fur family transcriptional regulator, ferric uptake regulator